MKNLNFSEAPESLKEAVEIIKQNGFKPIAITTIICEHTFCFETDDEAKEAFNKLETTLKVIQGWWYGKDSFLESVKEAEVKFYDGEDLNVYWL